MVVVVVVMLALMNAWKLGIEESRSHLKFQKKLCRSMGDTNFYRFLGNRVPTNMILNQKFVC